MQQQPSSNSFHHKHISKDQKKYSTNQIARTNGAEAINDVNEYQTGLDLTGENKSPLLHRKFILQHHRNHGSWSSWLKNEWF